MRSEIGSDGMGMSAFTLFRRAEDATGSGADARARRGIFSKERWRKKEEEKLTTRRRRRNKNKKSKEVRSE